MPTESRAAHTVARLSDQQIPSKAWIHVSKNSIEQKRSLSRSGGQDVE